MKNQMTFQEDRVNQLRKRLARAKRANTEECDYVVSFLQEKLALAEKLVEEERTKRL